MKVKFSLMLAFLGSLFATGFPQARFSMGLSGGLNMMPLHQQFQPMLGISAWYCASPRLFLSGEYLSFAGLGRYPAMSSGFVRVVNDENSRSQRLEMGFHYPVIKHNHHSLSLLGINLGQSWEKRVYAYFKLPFPAEALPASVQVVDHVQHSLIYASWTALSQNSDFPFFLQARYGYTFSHRPLFGALDPEPFGQMVVGLHLGIF